MAASADDNMEALTAEIQRVIASPYPVSLKNLDSITHCCSPDCIDRWAYARPEHVTPLATAVIDSLQSWPFTLDLLHKFIVTVPFRDSILFQAPLLLEQLIQKALNVDDVTSRYGQLCLRFLSEPLPAEVSLPRNAENFFLRVFDYAMLDASSDSVLPIYQLLNGACNGLLEILSSANLEGFQKHLMRVMKSVKSVEDHSLSLLCLAILSKIDGAHANMLADTNSFYRGSRADKTAHLLILQVLYACKDEQLDSRLDVRLRIKLARDIALVIPDQKRKEFAKQNQSILRKLQDKIQRMQPQSSVLLESFSFFYLFIEPSDVNSKLLDSFVGFVTLRVSHRPLDTGSQDLLTGLLKALIPKFASHHWLHILQITFDECALQVGLLTEKRHALCSLFVLLVDLRPFPIVSAKIILQSISDVHALKQLKVFLSAAPVLDDHQRKLGIYLCEILVMCALSDPSGANVLEPRTWTILLEKQKQLAIPVVSVDRRESNVTGPVRFCEAVCTPTEQSTSRDWRVRLAELFENENRCRHESVARLVEHICHDLEERCNTAEAPAREVTSQYEKVMSEKTQLENALNELKAEKAKLQEAVSGVEAARIVVDEERASMETELTAVRASAQQTEARFDEFRDCTERTQATEREEHQRCQLELRAELARQVEELDTCKDALTDAELQLGNLSAELQGSRQLVQTLELQLQDSIENSAAKEFQLVELLRDTEESQKRIQSLEDIMNTRDERIQSLEQQNETLILGSKRAQQDLEQQHEDLTSLHAELDAAKGEQQTLSISLHTKNEKLEEYGMQLVRTRAEADMLQTKVQSLEREKLKMTRDLERANEMRARLVVAMGSPRTPAMKPRSVHNHTNTVHNGHPSDTIAGFESAFNSSLTNEEPTPNEAVHHTGVQAYNGVDERNIRGMEGVKQSSEGPSVFARTALSQVSSTNLNKSSSRQRAHFRTKSETHVSVARPAPHGRTSDLFLSGDRSSGLLSRTNISGDRGAFYDENEESTAEL